MSTDPINGHAPPALSIVPPIPTPEQQAQKRVDIMTHGPVMLGLQMVHAEFTALNGGVEPDFLLVPGDRLKDLRAEMRMAFKCEMPSVDDIKRGAAAGDLTIGGFPVFVGVRYGAGIYA